MNIKFMDNIFHCGGYYL